MLKNTNIFHGGIRLLLPVIIVLLVGFLVLGIFSVKPINAQPAPYLNYQGRLENSNGNLLTGNYYVAFCIYTSTTATACAPASTPATGAITTLNGAVWGEVQYFSSTNSPSNEIENGVFNANLGLYSPLSGSLFNSGSAFYLGVNVYNGSTWDGQMTPLQQIDQVAYAMNAAMLDGYGAATPTGANQIVATSSSGYITLSGTNPEVNATGSNTLTLNGSGATGDVCFFACTTANITSSGNELLSGNIDITGTSTNTISGNTTFNNNITVSGSTTTTGIQNNGNLTNTGTGSFGGNVAITGGTLNLNNTTSNTIDSTTNLTIEPLNITEWTATTPLLTNTQDATSVVYNGYVYEIGGNNVTTVDYAPINANGTLGAWTATTPLLTSTFYATSIEYNGYIYEIGGANGSATFSTVDYAPINANGTLGAWTATTPLLVATWGATSVVYNGYVYEIGGINTLTTVDYAPINANGTLGAWTATTSLPANTYRATSVVYNGYIYEIGGCCQVATVDYAPINANGTLGAWTATTSLPTATYWATSVAYNGYVYEIGGNNGSSYVATVDYAPINANGTLGAWTATTSIPASTQEATSVVYNGYIYEIGGSGTATVDYISTNFINSIVGWISATSLPVATWGATSVEYNGYVYEMGGVNTTTTVDYAPINVNGTLGSWTATTPLPTAISQFATSVAYNGYVYEIGGYNGGVLATVYYAPINSNGTLGTWTATTSLLSATYKATSVVYNGYIYEIGGVNSAGTTATVDYSTINSDGTIGTWTATTNLPSALNASTSVIYGRYIYEIGGSGTAVVYYVPILSLGALGEWTATTSLPVAISSATSVVYNGYVYEIGGNNVATVYYAPINSDGIVGAWTATTSIPTSTFYATSVEYNGYVYEIGGANGSSTFSTVYYFSLIYGSLNITNSINNNTLISLNGFTGDITTAGNLTVGSGSPGGVNTINGNTILTSADLNVSGLPTPTGLATGSTSNVGGLLPAGTYYYEVVAQNITPLSTSISFPSQSISVTVNTTISPPTGVTSSVGTSGSVGSNLVASTTYYYVITATTPNGETTKSLEVSAAEVAIAYPITISWSADSGATGYNIYKGTVSGQEQFLASVSGGSTTSYVDSGNQATTTWPTTTSLPVAIDEATSVVYNGYVYEIGGYTTAATATVDYAPINSDGTLGSWTATTPLPTTISMATSVVYNGYVYEIGGWNGSTVVATVDYAPINSDGTLGSWTATTSLPAATYVATSIVYNGYVYEIGGSGTAVVDYAPILSSGALGSWVATTSLPVTTDAATSVIYNGYVYEIGGYTTAATAVVDYAPVNSNGTLGSWITTTSLPTTTQGATSVVYNGYVYEIGGENSNGGAAVATVDYAPINSNGTLGAWTATTSLPTATSDSTSVVYNGYVYDIGGGTGTGSTVVSTVDYFNLNSPSVPPLTNTATTNTNQVPLSWNVVSGAGTYNIYRSTSPNFTNATEYISNTNSFTDTNMEQTTPLPTTTDQATSVVYNGYVYEIGGENSSGTALSTVDYAPINSDGTLGSWTATNSLPVATYFATSVVYNGYLYEIGGSNGSAVVATVDYASINSNGTLGAWTATTSLPEAIHQATSIVYNGYIYEIGGYNGVGNVSTVDYAAINSNGTLGSWTNTTSLPNGIIIATSVEYNGYLYEIGGNEGGVLATVDYAPILSSGGLGAWTTTTSLPQATEFATSVVYNGYIYEIGGKNGSTSLSTIYYSPILSNGTLGTWQQTVSLPIALSDATSVIARGYVYEIGGYNNNVGDVGTVYYFKAMVEGGLLQQSKGSVQTNVQISQNNNGNLNLTGGVNIGGGISVLGQSNFGSSINLTNPNNDIIAASAPLDIQSSGFSLNLGRNNYIPQSPANPNISSWTSTTPLSVATYYVYATSVVYNGYMYEIGGNQGGTIIATVDYAPINSNGTLGSWTATTPLPNPTYQATSVVYNGYIYEMGGIAAGSLTSQIWYAPINSNGTLGSWAGAGGLPVAIDDATSVVYNGYMYEIGGCPSTCPTIAVDYASINSNGTLGVWTAASSLPQATDFATSVVYNGYVYEIGGGSSSGALSIVDYAPINSNGTLGAWTATTSLPTATEYATSVVYNGYVYEMGGNNNPTVTTVDYAPILSKGTLGSWVATTSLPVNTYGATSVIDNGYTYYIGGYASAATVYYSSQLTQSASPGYFTIASNINGGTGNFSDIFSLDPYGNAIFAGSLTTGGTPADVAEEVIGSSASPGDIVSASSINPASSNINNFTAIPTTHPYSNNMIGVISTNPSIILHQQNLPNALPLALAGRVLVKVTNYNGNIKIGSMITGSRFAGYGEVATSSGQVVGMALNSLNSNTPGVSTFIYNNNTYLKGEILMLVKNEYYNPITSQVSGLSSQDIQYIGGNITITNNLTVAGSLTIGGNIISNGSTPIIILNPNSGTGANATLNSGSTDIAGVVNFTTGTPSLSSGTQFVVKFKTPYTAVPRVLITPSNPFTGINMNALGVYVIDTTKGFNLDFSKIPPSSSLFSWNYFIIQ
ncbi:MAG: hypothetical protein ACYDAS_02035 [Patescibacteria group bacterium]